MSHWLNQKRVDRLVRQIGDIDLGPNAAVEQGASLNATEDRFFRAAMTKHKAKVWRHGWPDFLVHTEKLGFVGVEVKAGNDKVRPNQARMFEALEAAGVKIYVWHASHPDALVPWRKFASGYRCPVVLEPSSHAVTGSGVKSGRRLRELERKSWRSELNGPRARAHVSRN